MRSGGAATGIYLRPKMAVLLAFGFASGLPFPFTGDLLQAWLKESGVGLGTIGLFGLVALPYSLKVLWAPAMDRFVPPWLGRRRGWAVAAQAAVLVAVVAMAGTGPAAPWLFAAAALAVAAASASQDIALDAYRTDVLAPPERGPGAAVFTTGYRIAAITAGAGGLILADRIGSWPAVYLALAALLAVGAAAAAAAPEPEGAAARPASLRAAVVEPFRSILARPGGALILAFPLLFKLPDIAAAKMTLPFLLDIGFSKTEIGAIRQGLGVVVTIGATLAGGAVVARWGLRRSIWAFAVLQAASNLGFCLLAWAGPSRAVLLGVVAIENACTGLVTAGYLAFLMAQCDPRYSATQFALLTSVGALARDGLGAFAGFAAAALGWPLFFAATVLVAAPGMAILPRLLRSSD